MIASIISLLKTKRSKRIKGEPTCHNSKESNIVRNQNIFAPRVLIQPFEVSQWIQSFCSNSLHSYPPPFIGQMTSPLLSPWSDITQILRFTDLRPNSFSIVLLVEPLIMGNPVFAVHKPAQDVSSLM